MAARFGKLMSTGGIGYATPSEADRAKVAFVRARSRARLQTALAWVLAAVFSFFMAMFVSFSGRFSLPHPGLIMGIVFLGCALVIWLMSFSRQPERWYASFTGDPQDTGK